MPLLSWTDFSGGMVTDVNPTKVPPNTMFNLENVDVWSEIGVIQPLNNLAAKTDFPSSQVYDNHIIFPAHGDKDYALIMMTNGRIYSYDGTTFTLINSSASDQQAGAKMVYAGDRAFVFYRNATGSTIFRRVITYDYDTSTFSISDGEVSERFSIDSKDELDSPGYAANDNHAYKCIITSLIEGGLAETKGRKIDSRLIDGTDNFVIIDRDSDFEQANVYLSLRNIDQNEQSFLSPQFFLNIKGSSDKTYVPFVSGSWARGDLTPAGEGALATDVLKVYYEHFTAATDLGLALAYICELYDAGTASYIDVGHKIRFNDQEFTIASITKDTTNKVFAIDVNATLPSEIATFFPEPPISPFNIHGGVLEVELTWDSDKFFIPIQMRARDLLGIQIDEMRPETNFLNGTGDRVAYAKNFLFTSNPYFDDTFNVGETEDKKGFIAWSFIDGLGQKDFLTIPNTNLLGIHSSAAEIVDLVSFRDQPIIFHKNGMSRLSIRDGIPIIYDSEDHGVDDQYNYYIDDFNVFIYSNGKIKRGFFNRRFLEEGDLSFSEISRGIASLVDPSGTPDIRFGYDSNKELLFCHDDDGDWADDLICSFRNGGDKPAWIKYSSTSKADVYGSFELAGVTHFVVDDGGNWEVWDNTGSKVGDCEIQSHDVYFTLGEDYLRKVEIAYQGNGGAINLVLTLDGVDVHTLTLSYTSTPIIKEFDLDRNKELRFSRLSWKLTGSFPSDFKLFGVWINRDSYGREASRGY